MNVIDELEKLLKTEVLIQVEEEIATIRKFVEKQKDSEDLKIELDYMLDVKKYYDEVIKPKRELIKQPRKKKTFQVDYITPTGEKVIVVLKSENKQCKKCNEVKHYQEFQHMKDKIHKNIFYLNPRCKKCCGERQCMKNKDVLLKLIENDINTQQL